MASDACPYPEEPCVACANGLAGFMSERATGTAFGSTCCVGGVGTSAASMDSSAGEEASNAPGIASVRTASQRLAVTASIISRGSIRPDECAVGGPLYESAPHGVPYERSQMETRRESGTGPVRLVTGTFENLSKLV